jgi:hypothetical protein
MGRSSSLPSESAASGELDGSRHSFSQQFSTHSSDYSTHSSVASRTHSTRDSTPAEQKPN